MNPGRLLLASVYDLDSLGKQRLDLLARRVAHFERAFEARENFGIHASTVLDSGKPNPLHQRGRKTGVETGRLGLGLGPSLWPNP